VSLIGVHYASGQKLVDKPIKLKTASHLPPPEFAPLAEVFKMWQDEVTKRTNGGITFETIWGGALDSGPAHFDHVKKGTVDMIQAGALLNITKFPITNLEYVFPFGPVDCLLVTKAMRKIRSEFPQFAADDTRENIIMIANCSGGRYDFMSTKPLRTIDDFKGEKVSLIGRYFGRWLPPGAAPVVRPFTDRYDLIRNGVVKVDLLPFEHFYSIKLWEVTKYYTKVGIMAGLYCPLFMNLDSFKRFSPEIQKLFLEVGQEVEMKGANEIIPKWWEKMQKTLIENKITINEFPMEEKEKQQEEMNQKQNEMRQQQRDRLKKSDRPHKPEAHKKVSGDKCASKCNKPACVNAKQCKCVCESESKVVCQDKCKICYKKCGDTCGKICELSCKPKCDANCGKYHPKY